MRETMLPTTGVVIAVKYGSPCIPGRAAATEAGQVDRDRTPAAQVGQHRRPRRRGHPAPMDEQERLPLPRLQHPDAQRRVGERDEPRGHVDAVMREQPPLGRFEIGA
jgi:hypothetical protein